MVRVLHTVFFFLQVLQRVHLCSPSYGLIPIVLLSVYQKSYANGDTAPQTVQLPDATAEVFALTLFAVLMLCCWLYRVHCTSRFTGRIHIFLKKRKKEKSQTAHSKPVYTYKSVIYPAMQLC